MEKIKSLLVSMDGRANRNGGYNEHIDRRFGNLTITNQYWNTKYGTLPFIEKKRADSNREVAYRNSNLRVQRDLATHDTFNDTTIEERELNIIDFALDHWAIKDEPEIPVTA